MFFERLREGFYLTRPDKNFIPIHYRGFWDVPLAFFTEYNGELYLFYAPDSDDEIDDYPPNYEIYRIKEVVLEDALQNNLWHPCSFENKIKVGEVPKNSIEFDITLRKFVNGIVLEKLFEQDSPQEKS